MSSQRLLLLVICGAALGSAPALAQTQPLAGEVINCGRIAGAAERLACYDNVAHGVAGQAAVPRPPAIAPAYSAPAYPAPVYSPPSYAPPAAAMATPQAQFGAEKMEQSHAATAPDRLPALVSPVTAYRLNADGKFTLALANGQVWKQLDGDTMAEMPKSHQVKITHGFFGSYNLVFIGSNVSFKVTRIK